MRGILLSLLWIGAGAAWAQSADVGLVNLVSGEVMFVPVNGRAAPVRPFMRVREGDRFNLRADAQLRVVFFEGARQERWSGPASFRAARALGEPISGRAAEVTRLPTAAPTRIARFPEFLQNAKLGGIQVRGAPRDRESSSGASAASDLRAAREAYEDMRRQLPADDVTPELFLYAALQEHERYDELQAVVDEMLRKQPSSEDVQALAKWVKSRNAR